MPHTTYIYDEANRLETANGPTGQMTYQYDAPGNRTQFDHCLTGQGCNTTTYTYDTANRLESSNGPAGQVTYQYDANGNLLTEGGKTYGYDSANRLISYSLGDPPDTAFTYNGLGDRLTQTVGGQATTYTLDLAAGLTQVLNDEAHTYLYGNMRIAQQSVGGTEYFLTDALGSVRQMVDETGALTLAQAYQPYGETWHSSGSSASPYGFAGEYTDSQTGLQYLRARYYAPGVGRFLTKDPSRLEQNLYHYASANPVNRRDPLGLYSCPTATVDDDDTAWDIWALHGQPYMSWEAFQEANTHIPNLGSIQAGDIIYVPGYCPSGTTTPPTSSSGPYHYDNFTGYLEGYSDSFTMAFIVWATSGREVVYNFATLERAEFTFKGDYSVYQYFCGFSTNIFSLGTSNYVGGFHFPPLPEQNNGGIRGEYQGTSLVVSFGAGTGLISHLPAPLGNFDLGGEVSLFASTNGPKFLKVPTVPDISRMRYGVSVAFTQGSSISRVPLGLSVTQVFLNYAIVEAYYEQYSSAEEMAKDIESGAHSYNLRFPSTPVLYPTRQLAANHLRWMYTP